MRSAPCEKAGYDKVQVPGFGDLEGVNRDWEYTVRYCGKLEAKKLFRFAEQLRGAGMSMSNNIAEGSGSSSKTEFRNFLNIAKRSTFENANILIILNKRELIADDILEDLLDRLDHLCRKTTNF